MKNVRQHLPHFSVFFFFLYSFCLFLFSFFLVFFLFLSFFFTIFHSYCLSFFLPVFLPLFPSAGRCDWWDTDASASFVAGTSQVWALTQVRSLCHISTFKKNKNKWIKNRTWNILFKSPLGVYSKLLNKKKVRKMKRKGNFSPCTVFKMTIDALIKACETD